MADLFDVLDWMMPLPESMQRSLVAQVQSLQRRFNMPFENCLVKYAKLEARATGLAEGRAEGRALGRAEGHAEGHAEGQAEGRRLGALHLIHSMLALRFGQLAPDTLASLGNATEGQLDRLALAVMRAESLEAALIGAGLAPGPSAADA